MEIRKCVVLAALAACAAAGCGDERKPLPGSEGGAAQPAEQLTEQQTRTAISSSRPTTPAPAEHDSAPSLLKPEGIGSQAELDHALAKLDDAAARAQFENGFRACFTTDRDRRNYASAVPAMEGVLQSHPNFAPAFRVLAYAYFNMSFDMEKAIEYYEKAIAADPDYGEAHYALSFMLTQSDLERGRRHFERAMKLGVPDERDLRGQFYP